MSTTTKNFGLTVPELSDAADFTATNPNWETIDQQLAIANKPVVASSTDGEEYTATVDGVTELYKGLEITIIPNKTATSKYAELDVNGLGSYSITEPIHHTGGTTGALMYPDTVKKNIPFKIRFDGEGWVLVEHPNVSVSAVHGTLPIINGGTGATSAQQARANLEVSKCQYADMLQKADGNYYASEKLTDYQGNGYRIYTCVGDTNTISPVSLFISEDSTQSYKLKVWSVKKLDYVDVPVGFFEHLGWYNIWFHPAAFWVVDTPYYPPTTYTAYTLRANKWVGDTAPYTYLIDDEEYVGKEVNVYDDGALATAEQLDVLASANIKGSPTSAENILYAFGDKPTIDLPVALGVK